MVKRTLAAVAAVLALGGAGWRVLASSADDVGRDGSIIVHHLPERPPAFPRGHLPPFGQGSVEVPVAVTSWTDRLSSENAKKVIEDACKLKDLSAVVITDADIQQWALLRGYVYGEDKLTALVGLAKEARGNTGVKVFCDVVG